MDQAHKLYLDSYLEAHCHLADEACLRAAVAEAFLVHSSEINDAEFRAEFERSVETLLGAYGFLNLSIDGVTCDDSNNSIDDVATGKLNLEVETHLGTYLFSLSHCCIMVYPPRRKVL